MLNSLLTVDSSQIATYVILGIAVVAIIAMMVWSSKRRKKQEQDAQNLIDAVKPGNKVKTIGGICGIVVEVDSAENTFVLETGTEQSGKCFIKFDRQAIYQTDAVVEKPEEAPKADADNTDDVLPLSTEENEKSDESAQNSEELLTVSGEIAEVEEKPAEEKPENDK